MNSTKHAILITIYSVLVKGGQHYCTPYPDTVRELLEKYHDIDIGRRWYFQCCRDLENGGYARRQRRWEKLPGPEIRSLSSIWALTVRGVQYLIKKGVSGARALLKGMVDWLRRDDRRRPTANDLAGYNEDVDRKRALELIRGIIEKIG